MVNHHAHNLGHWPTYDRGQGASQGDMLASIVATVSTICKGILQEPSQQLS